MMLENAAGGRAPESLSLIAAEECRAAVALFMQRAQHS